MYHCLDLMKYEVFFKSQILKISNIMGLNLQGFPDVGSISSLGNTELCIPVL